MARVPIYVRTLLFWLLFVAFIAYFWIVRDAHTAIVYGMIGLGFGVVGLVTFLVGRRFAKPPQPPTSE